MALKSYAVDGDGDLDIVASDRKGDALGWNAPTVPQKTLGTNTVSAQWVITKQCF